MKKVILLLPILAGIMFGSVGVFVRTLSANGMDNVTILFLRVAFASLAMFIGIMIYDRTLLKIKLKDGILFVGTGILGMMCLNLCYNEAINRLSLSLAAVLLSTAPVFVMFLAAIIFKEKVTARKIVCMLCAIVGCVLVSGLLEQGAGSISWQGLCTGIAAAAFYALYSIFSRLATDRGYHTYTVIIYSVLIITLALFPFSDFEKMGNFLAEDTIFHLLFLLIHSLCTSVLPYVFITYALLYAEAGRVSILASGGEPIAPVVFGIMFYAEIPSLLMLIGLVVTILALTFLCMEPEKK